MSCKEVVDAELVVNWHITESCNYSCNYCFAKWGKQKKELLNDDVLFYKLIDEIEKLPSILNDKYMTAFKNVRINLVGGETFLNKRKIKKIIYYANEKGFAISAITNGSRLDKELKEIIAKSFCSIGFSVDSLDEHANKKIGRIEKSKVMNVEKIIEDINLIKSINPNIDIKINTVVSNINKSEDLSHLIEQVEPKKWKVFKVLPVITHENNISQADFIKFLERHKAFKEIIFSEDNNEMTDSYIMIDPIGRFFQNSKIGEGYIYSSPITDIGIEKAFREVNFDANRFYRRYKHKLISIKEVV